MGVLKDTCPQQEWRNACGDVYTITVAEAIKVAEYGFRKNLGCEPKD
jgi:hypothetical protein